MDRTGQHEPRHEIATVKSAIQVIEFLFGDILAFRSLREIAMSVNLSNDKVYRILLTLVKSNWAEKSDHGFRLATEGLIKHLVYAQDYLTRLTKNYGLKTKI